MDFRHELIKAYSWVSKVSGYNRWIINRLTKRNITFILAYHWIDLDNLMKHLNFLREFFDFCSLDDIAKEIKEGRSFSRPKMAVTFDDGYADVIENAVRMARIYEIPMAFYLPTHFIDKGKPYWFIELPALIKSAVGHSIRYKGETFTIRSENDLDRTYRVLRQKIVGHRPKPVEIENSMRQIRLSLPSSVVEETYKTIPEPISWKRVRELAKDSLVCFGSHSVSHPFLSALNKDEIEQELVVSQEKIQEITGRPIKHFCYPYGTPNDIGDNARSIARLKYITSTTMIRGAFKPGADKAYLARIPVYQRDSTEIVLNKVCHAAREHVTFDVFQFDKKDREEGRPDAIASQMRAAHEM